MSYRPDYPAVPRQPHSTKVNYSKNYSERNNCTIMATYTPASREERLARLKQMQEELAKVNTGWESGVLTLENGVTTIRVLPPVGNMNQNFFHQPVGYHMIGNTVARCSEFTTGNEIKCPICEVIEVLRRSGKNGKDLASKIRLNKKYWINVITRDKDDQFDTANGPYILKAGVTIFNALRGFVMDPDYGVIDDPEEGVDIKITKTGEKINTEYQIATRRGNKGACPLMQRPIKQGGKITGYELAWDVMQKIIESAQDLTPVEMPDNPDDDEIVLAELDFSPAVKVFSYDRTVLQFGVSLDTINQLEEIIAKNSQEGGRVEGGEDGRIAQPQRGYGQRSAQGNSRDASSAVKDRIAALRAKG